MAIPEKPLSNGKLELGLKPLGSQEAPQPYGFEPLELLVQYSELALAEFQFVEVGETPESHSSSSLIRSLNSQYRHLESERVSLQAHSLHWVPTPDLQFKSLPQSSPLVLVESPLYLRAPLDSACQ